MHRVLTQFELAGTTAAAELQAEEGLHSLGDNEAPYGIVAPGWVVLCANLHQHSMLGTIPTVDIRNIKQEDGPSADGHETEEAPGRDDHDAVAPPRQGHGQAADHVAQAAGLAPWSHLSRVKVR